MGRGKSNSLLLSKVSKVNNHKNKNIARQVPLAIDGASYLPPIRLQELQKLGEHICQAIVRNDLPVYAVKIGWIGSKQPRDPEMGDEILVTVIVPDPEKDRKWSNGRGTWKQSLVVSIHNIIRKTVTAYTPQFVATTRLTPRD